MSTRCASCGQHNPEPSRFCSFCGRLLHGPADGSTASCPLCGAVFADQVACRTHQAAEHGLAAVRAAAAASGLSLDEPPIEAPTPPEPWYRRPLLVGPVAVLIVIAAVATGLTIGGSRSSTVRVAQTAASTRPPATTPPKPLENPPAVVPESPPHAEPPAVAPPVSVPDAGPPTEPLSQESPPTTASTTPASPKPLVIKESAFTVSSSCSSGSACPANWVAVATNPNTGFYARALTLRATARNASDVSVGEATAQVRQIPPGVTFAVTGRVPATAPPKTIEVTAEQVDWAEAPAGPDRYPAFGVNEMSMSPSGIGAYQVQGQVTNPYKTSFQLMNVTVLLRDTSGKLVGGETTWLDRIGPRETKPFQVDVSDQVATVPAKAEAIAYPWGAASWLTAQR